MTIINRSKHLIVSENYITSVIDVLFMNAVWTDFQNNRTQKQKVKPKFL
jgi:hypothetical protein